MTDSFLTRPQALTRISRGDILYMEHREGERCWWFDGPYEEVGDDVIQEIAFKPGRVCELIEHGDSLFGEVNSQSWKGRVVEKVKEKAIPFSAPMVRAILDGRKGQTRRILKPQPASMIPNVLDISSPERDEDGQWGQRERIWSDWTLESRGEPLYEVWCPLRLPYATGDRIWVKEAWRTEARFDALPPRDVPEGAIVSYEADYDYEPNDGCRGRYRHSWFLPRWASRLTLEVTDVRVQRLWEISEADAWMEGIDQRVGAHCQDDFAALWQSLHGPDAWSANPWVAAISFERVSP